MRQLVDAGTLSNLPGGLKTRGLRIKGVLSPLIRRPRAFKPAGRLERVPASTSCSHCSCSTTSYKFLQAGWYNGNYDIGYNPPITSLSAFNNASKCHGSHPMSASINIKCVEYLVTRWYKNYKQYSGINNAKTTLEAAQQLTKQGYATDPVYAAKLITLVQRLKDERIH